MSATTPPASKSVFLSLNQLNNTINFRRFWFVLEEINSSTMSHKLLPTLLYVKNGKCLQKMQEAQCGKIQSHLFLHVMSSGTWTTSKCGWHLLLEYNLELVWKIRFKNQLILMNTNLWTYPFSAFSLQRYLRDYRCHQFAVIVPTCPRATLLETVCKN
jgi:hypothetical protein